ncbi:MAG: hypothetical protein JJU02_05285 [Cryomorphaceae bacterium]|nr:hypothetical protein [Cryomorphaceae bacterium]
MSKTYNVIIKGTGQLNGQVRIDKTFEVDEQQAKLYRGNQRYKAITGAVAFHYPGVEINPRNLSVNVVPIAAPKKSKSKSKSVFRGNPLFLPFRIAWYLVRRIWRLAETGN